MTKKIYVLSRQLGINLLKVVILSNLLMLISVRILNAMPFSYADVPPYHQSFIQQIIVRVTEFLSRALPDSYLLLFPPILLLFALASAWFVGYLRSKKNVRTAFTRKIFHFIIFTGAGILQMFSGLSGVVLFGCIVSFVVIFAVIKGKGYPFYEALARQMDEPHRSTFIIIPLITTAIGGVLSNILFFPFAYLGYFVCGWGDAIGEPVGAAWGKHRYKVPSWKGVKVTRSIEGSMAIFLIGSIISILAIIFSGYSIGASILVGLACGMTGALIEAISTHGFDNLTVQVVVSAVAFFLLN